MKKSISATLSEETFQKLKQRKIDTGVPISVQLEMAVLKVIENE